MANDFTFRIVALDKFTKVFRDLNTQASKVARPVTSIGRQFAALGREMHLDKAAAAMGKMAGSSVSIARNLGIALPAFEGLAGMSAGIGGIAAALGVAAAGAGALGLRVGALGTNISRASARMGIGTRDLQRFRGAAQEAGLSADSAEDSMAGLSKRMHEARWGRDNEARALILASGGFATKADGSLDPAAEMMRLADFIAKMPTPQARLNAMGHLGISEDLYPLISGGSAALRRQMLKAQEDGLVLTEQEVKQAERLNVELARFGSAITGLANTVGTKVMPGMTSLTHFLDDLVRDPWNTIMFGQRGGTSGSGGGSAAAPAGSAGAPIGALPLGLRQHNPGNLRRWGNRPIVNGFASFDSDQAGLDAMANQLEIYQGIRGVRTLRDLVGKYAPAGDRNNVAAYLNDMTSQTGFGADDKLDFSDAATLRKVMRGLVRHEQGRQPFSDAQYSQAAAQAVQLEVHVKVETPPGTTAKASVKADGVYTPARITRAMSTGSEVE